MRIKLTVVMALACVMIMTGCVSEKQVLNIAGSTVDELKVQAGDELKKAFANEVVEFFKSNDLSKSLGIDSDEQQKIAESIKQYIDNYDMDDEKLKEAQKSVENLLENAKGLSSDEIENKISEIFSEQ